MYSGPLFLAIWGERFRSEKARIAIERKKIRSVGLDQRPSLTSDTNHPLALSGNFFSHYIREGITKKGLKTQEKRASFLSRALVIMVEKESIRVVAEGTLPTGYSDDGGSFNEGEDDVEDGSGHKSVISDDDTRNSPSSRRSSGQDSSQYMMKNGDDDDLTIAKRENQAVMISRMTFIAVLVLITVGISVGVFVYVDGQEQSAFELYFGEDSYLIFSKLGESVYERFAQLDSMTVALASAYINVTSDISAQWPLGTYHDFAVMASKARSLSQAVAFQQYYFVPNNQDVRAVWEDYAREHGSDWITQTLKVLVDDESYQGKKPSLLSGARQPYNTTQETAEEGIQYAAEVLPPNSGP